MPALSTQRGKGPSQGASAAGRVQVCGHCGDKAALSCLSMGACVLELGAGCSQPLFPLLQPPLPPRRTSWAGHWGRGGPAPLGLAHVPGYSEMAPGSGLLGSGILIGPRRGAGPGHGEASLAAVSSGPLWPRWLGREEPPWGWGRGRGAVPGWVRGIQLRVRAGWASPVGGPLGRVRSAGGWGAGGQCYRGPGLSPALAGGGRGKRAWRRVGPRSSSRRPASSCAPCSRRPRPAPRHAAPGALRGRAAGCGRPPGAGGSPG